MNGASVKSSVNSSVDFLLIGSHPAFFWAAAVLQKKGKKVVLVPHPQVHLWECIPSEVVPILGLDDFVVDRNENPIQVLTSKKRVCIYADRDFTQKDFKASVDAASSPEVIRGYTYYAKGSDFPSGIGEEMSTLIDECLSLEYFEFKGADIQKQALATLKKMGVQILDDERGVTAEQTLKLEYSPSQVFRWKFEIVLPLNKTHVLPVGATSRMLFIEKNAPALEMIQQGGLRVRALLMDDLALLEKETQDLLVQRIISALHHNFPETHWKAEDAAITPRNLEQCEFRSVKRPVEISSKGVWKFHLALDPAAGERTLYIRISELLTQKFKKQPIFSSNELMSR